MSTSAIILMIVAMLVIWGGLVLAIINLNRGNAGAGPLDEEHRDL